MAVRYLKSWNLTFTGNERDDSEEFLEQLAEYIESKDVLVYGI